MDTFDPLVVLGCTREEAQDWLRGRPVTPGEVEAAAALHYQWRAHLHDDASYWVTIGQAMQLLGSDRAAVRRLVATRRLRAIRHVSGVWLMRRDHVVAYAATRRTSTSGRSRIPTQMSH